jgi:hypothetical protein
MNKKKPKDKNPGVIEGYNFVRIIADSLKIMFI